MAGEQQNQLLLRLRDNRLEFYANGKSATAAADSADLTEELRGFAKSTDLPNSGNAWCFIPARGVTLRRIKLPATTPANREQLLRLQIEREFPLPPDKMAWGWREIANEKNEVLVAAVRKDLVDPIAEALHTLGLTARFMPDILTEGLAEETSNALTVLNLGKTVIELARFESGIPMSVRTFSRNGDDDSQLASRLARAANGSQVIQCSGDQPLATAIRDVFEGKVKNSDGNDLDSLSKLIASERINQLPILRLSVAEETTSKISTTLPVRWMALAALLLVGLFCTRYLGAFIGEARLQQELADIEQRQTGFPAINQEVNFLQHIQKNQPPYLAALAVFSDAAPRGTKVESLSIDRRGEFSFRGQLQNSQNASDLRTKLIESGLFSNVVMEEQSTVPNKKQVNVRFTARWNTDPKAKSDVLKHIDAKAEESKNSKSSSRR